MSPLTPLSWEQKGKETAEGFSICVTLTSPPCQSESNELERCRAFIWEYS